MAHNNNHYRKPILSGEEETQIHFTDDIFDRALTLILGEKSAAAVDRSLKVRLFNMVIDGDGREVKTR